MANHLTHVQLAYNTSYHESIGDILYRVIFKEMPRTLLQAAADSVCRITEHNTTSPMAYVENSLTSVPDICQKVRKTTVIGQMKDRDSTTNQSCTSPHTVLEI